MKKLIITIDGPAASGKSTTARNAANQLGYFYIDTGAMYRAMTLKVLDSGIQIDDSNAISQLADVTQIELKIRTGILRTILDGVDVSEEIRQQRISNNMGPIVEVGYLRDVMVNLQREMGKKGGVVVEGRDTGTVVFPNADLKFYMDADVQHRAARRQKELARKGVHVDLAQLIGEIVERDKRDSTRSRSPLKPAPDAILIDTSDLTIEEQTAFIVKKAKEIINTNRNI